MKNAECFPSIQRSVGRRSFMKSGLLAGGAVLGAGLCGGAAPKTWSRRLPFTNHALIARFRREKEDHTC
jgi:hypothetical protein